MFKCKKDIKPSYTCISQLCLKCKNFDITYFDVPKAQEINELRLTTGADSVQCRNALSLCGNDIDEAIEYLRAAGYAIKCHCGQYER